MKTWQFAMPCRRVWHHARTWRGAYLCVAKQVNTSFTGCCTRILREERTKPKTLRQIRQSCVFEGKKTTQKSRFCLRRARYDSRYASERHEIARPFRGPCPFLPGHPSRL